MFRYLNFRGIYSHSLRKLNTRNISTSSTALVKVINEETSSDNKTLTVDAKIVESDRVSKLVKPCQGSESCHPFCRLPFEVKHTDVLILNQFVDSMGHVLPRRITGLCRRQQVRITKLVLMAQKACLMPNNLSYISPVQKNLLEGPSTNPVKYKWKNFNTYWHERTIDIQWRNKKIVLKRRSFYK